MTIEDQPARFLVDEPRIKVAVIPVHLGEEVRIVVGDRYGVQLITKSTIENTHNYDMLIEDVAMVLYQVQIRPHIREELQQEIESLGSCKFLKIADKRTAYPLEQKV